MVVRTVTAWSVYIGSIHKHSHTRIFVCRSAIKRHFLRIRNIGVNISDRKSGTERTKKRKKREFVCLSHRQGAQRSTWYIAYRSVRYMGFARATITRDIFIPSPTQCGLSRSWTNRQNTQQLTSLKREVALPSTGSWLPSRLSSTWRWKERTEGIFSNSKYANKAGHFKWKAGKRDGAKKAWVYARKRYCWHLWRKYGTRRARAALRIACFKSGKIFTGDQYYRDTGTMLWC